jgi:hypothetical protein
MGGFCVGDILLALTLVLFVVFVAGFEAVLFWRSCCESLFDKSFSYTECGELLFLYFLISFSRLIRWCVRRLGDFLGRKRDTTDANTLLRRPSRREAIFILGYEDLLFLYRIRVARIVNVRVLCACCAPVCVLGALCARSAACV